MTEATILPNVVVVGQLPHWTPTLRADSFRGASAEESVSRIAPKTRALIIGAGVRFDEVIRILPSIRTAFPTLSVIVVTEKTDTQHELAAWVDVVATDRQMVDRFLAQIEEDSDSSVAYVVIKQILSFAIPMAALMAMWALGVAVFDPPAYLLPSPNQVFNAFMTQPGRFALHVATTAWEAALGFMVGNSLGIAFAIVLTKYLRLKAFTLPVLISLQAIPIVAFAPLLGVWLGTGLASKIAMAAMICFFPMVVNCLQAFANIERDFVDLFSLYRSSFHVRLKRLLLPASAPAIVAALKISAGLSVVGAIVAEMTGAERGLGYLILNGAYRLETDVLFVAMVLSGLLGISFFQLPRFVQMLLPSTWIQDVHV